MLLWPKCLIDTAPHGGHSDAASRTRTNGPSETPGPADKYPNVSYGGAVVRDGIGGSVDRVDA